MQSELLTREYLALFPIPDTGTVVIFDVAAIDPNTSTMLFIMEKLPSGKLSTEDLPG